MYTIINIWILQKISIQKPECSCDELGAVRQFMDHVGNSLMRIYLCIRNTL